MKFKSRKDKTRLRLPFASFRLILQLEKTAWQARIKFSANARQLLANLGGDDAVGAHCGAGDEHAFMFGSDRADAGCIFAQRMRAQDGENLLGSLGRYKENGFTLVGHVDRVESKQL